MLRLGAHSLAEGRLETCTTKFFFAVPVCPSFATNPLAAGDREAGAIRCEAHPPAQRRWGQLPHCAEADFAQACTNARMMRARPYDARPPARAAMHGGAWATGPLPHAGKMWSARASAHALRGAAAQSGPGAALMWAMHLRGAAVCTPQIYKAHTGHTNKRGVGAGFNNVDVEAAGEVRARPPRPLRGCAFHSARRVAGRWRLNSESRRGDERERKRSEREI